MRGPPALRCHNGSGCLPRPLRRARGACGSRVAPSRGRSRAAPGTCRSAAPPCDPPGRPAAQVPIQRRRARSSSEAGKPSIVERRLGQLRAPQLFDDLAGHAVLAQLGLHHAPPARRVPVALLRPPARECARRRGTPSAVRRSTVRSITRVLGAGTTQAPLQLPARARPRAQVAGGDLHGALLVRRLPWRGRPARHRSRRRVPVAGDVPAQHLRGRCPADEPRRAPSRAPAAARRRHGHRRAGPRPRRGPRCRPPSPGRRGPNRAGRRPPVRRRRRRRKRRRAAESPRRTPGGRRGRPTRRRWPRPAARWRSIARRRLRRRPGSGGRNRGCHTGQSPRRWLALLARRRTTRRRYSASLIPSTPTSIEATLFRISSSILVAISGFALRKSRAFSRPWPRRVSP